MLANSSNCELLVSLCNNVCNVRNVNSISQIVKTFNVTKIVCSSNASNSVICNSTCKPVSKFVSDCQSDKRACNLIYVNWKRSHGRLVSNKNSRQYDFTKPFSAMNILMMSIYFYELVILLFMFYHNFCNNNVDIFSKAMPGVTTKCNSRCNNKLLLNVQQCCYF